MSLKLIPDDVQPAVDLPPDVDQARAYLLALSTPTLDGFRKQVKTLKTSELLILMGDPKSVAQALALSMQVATPADQEVFMAALLALGDEIDRRIPIP